MQFFQKLIFNQFFSAIKTLFKAIKSRILLQNP